MNREHWRRLRAVLEPALELDCGQREAWLDANCDPQLRAEIDALVAAAERNESILDRPALRADGFLPAGTEIDPYVIEAPLGTGGMGVVYRAHDPRLRRTVAAKVLTYGGNLSDLLREARAAAALSHPNIVVVHDVLEYRDAPVIVTELVEGPTLAELLKDTPLEEGAAVDIALQVASALAAAHDAGIVHRDLKPANVIVRDDQVVKVLDFGIARPLEQPPGAAPRPAGTLGYAAPEQLRGSEPDVRWDVYSFGVLLRDLLQGTSPTDTLGRVAGSWEQVIARCTADDPRERFADMHEVARAVRARDRRGRPRQLLAVGLAVTLAVTATFLWMATREPPGVDSTIFATVELPGVQPDRRYPAISPDGRRVVFSARVDGAFQLQVQRLGEVNATPLGRAGRQASWAPDGRRLAYRSEAQGGGLFVLDTETGAARRLVAEGYHPDWSPDGARIVYSSEDFVRAEERPTTRSALSVLNLETGSIHRLTDPERDWDAIQPSWSADGRRIAYWSIRNNAERSIWTLPATGGAPRRLTDGAAQAWSPAWGPDGLLYWSSDRGGAMAVWRARVDTTSGELLTAPQTIPLPAGYVGYVDVSTAGALTFSSHELTQGIWRIALDGSGPAMAITPRGLRIGAPSVAPDGQRLVGFEEAPNNNLVIMGADGRDFHYLTTGRYRDRNPSWSPDGTAIAFMTNRGGQYEIWRIAPGGNKIGALIVLPSGAFSPIWSPDARQVVHFTRQFRPMLFDVASGTSTELPTPPAPGFRPTDWSPDGRRIAGVLRGHAGELLDAAYFDLQTRRYHALNARCSGLRWLPDGRLACTRDRWIFTIDLDDGTEHTLVEAPARITSGFDFDPDGRWAYVVIRSDVATVLMARPTG